MFGVETSLLFGNMKDFVSFSWLGFTLRGNQNKLSSSLTTFLNSFPRLKLVTYLLIKWRQIKFAVILVALKLISNDDGLIKIEPSQEWTLEHTMQRSL